MCRRTASRFLMLKPQQPLAATPLNVRVNWFDELRLRHLPNKREILIGLRHARATRSSGAPTTVKSTTRVSLLRSEMML